MKKFYFFMLALFACIAMSAENPTLYLLGSANSWSASDSYKFTESNGVYTLSLDEISGTFKIATSDWATAYGGASDIVAGSTYTLSTSGGDCSFKDAVKNATLTFTLSTGELKVEGAAAVAQYDLYLLGSLNDWKASDAYKFSTDDYVVYTLEAENVVNGDYGFQIAASDWAVRYNVESTELAYDTYTVVKGKEYNMKFATEPAGKVKFTLDTQALTLKIEEVVETPETESQYLNKIIGKFSGSVELTDVWSTNWACTTYTTTAYSSPIVIAKGEGVNALTITGLTIPMEYLDVKDTVNAKFVEDSSTEGYIGYIEIEPQVIGVCTDPTYPDQGQDITIAASWGSDSWYKTPTNSVYLWVTPEYDIVPGNWCLWGSFWSTWYMMEIGYYDGSLTREAEPQSEYLNDVVGKYSGTLSYAEAWSNAWYLSSYNDVEYNKDIPAVEIEEGDGNNEVIISNVTYPTDLITINGIKGTFVEDTTTYEGYIGYINIEPQVVGSYVDPYGTVNNDLTFSAAYDSSWYSTPTYPVAVWVSNNGYLSFGNWALWFGDEVYSGWWSRAEVGYYNGYLTKVTSSVSNIAVDENAPVEYYNLQGVRVANPSNGIYIQRQGNQAKKVLVK
jgi:hypothetical protein